MAKKIVFVDDSKTILKMITLATQDIVNKGIVEIQTYNDPTEFLDIVSVNQMDYDLLVTDINMPQMNGLDLIKILKNNPIMKMKPIIALTTEKSPQMKKLGKELGVAGWLAKPFTETKLLMALKMILGLKGI